MGQYNRRSEAVPTPHSTAVVLMLGAQTQSKQVADLMVKVSPMAVYIHPREKIGQYTYFF